MYATFRRRVGCLTDLSFKCCHGCSIDHNTALPIVIDWFLVGDNFSAQRHDVKRPDEVNVDDVGELVEIVRTFFRQDPSRGPDASAVDNGTKRLVTIFDDG